MPLYPPPSSGSGIPASTVTTKGDILVATASATVVRKGVGADGTVLVANSGQTDGMNWRGLTAADIASGTFPGSYTFTNGPTIGGTVTINGASAGLELGASGSTNTPYIDFHSGATAVDWDVRLIASGGTGSVSGGTLAVQAATLDLSLPVLKNTGTATGNVVSVAYNGATADNSSYGVVGVTAPAGVSTAYYSLTATGTAVYGVGMGADNTMRVGSVSTGKVMAANAVKIDSAGGVTITGALIAVNTSNDFGAGALGGAGGYLRVGSSGTDANILALSSATDANLLYTAKGLGTHIFNNKINALSNTIQTTGTVTGGTVTATAAGGVVDNGNRVYSASNPITAAAVQPGTFAASSQYIFPNGTWVAIQGVALDLSSANGTTGALGAGIGDKIALYGNTFGFGIQSNRLVAFLPSTAAFAVRAASGSGNASSGSDVFTVSGTGAVGASGLVTASAGISIPVGQPLTTGTRSVFTGTRAVTTNASDTIDLGSFSTTGGAMELRIHAHLVGGTSVVTKVYELAVAANLGTLNTWYLCLPVDASANAAATGDFALEVQRTAATTFAFRFRQKSIATIGGIAFTVEALGDTAVTFTPSSIVSTSPAAVSTMHPSNAFVAAAGQIGIGTDAPGALLDVRGTTSQTGDATITKNTAKLTMTDGTRTTAVGLATNASDIFTNSVAGDLVLLSSTRVYVPSTLVAVGQISSASPITASDIQVSGVSVPRGVIARAADVTANVSLGAAGAEITLVTLSATLVAGRKYRIVGIYPSATSTVTGDDIVFRMYAAATMIQNGARVRVTAAGLGFRDGPLEAWYSAGSSGAVSFTFRAIRVSGTGTGTVNAGATTPISMYVEDVGTV